MGQLTSRVFQETHPETLTRQKAAEGGDARWSHRECVWNSRRASAQLHNPLDDHRTSQRSGTNTTSTGKPFNRHDIGAGSNMSRLLHHQLTPIQMNRVRSQAILEQLAGLKDASAVGIRRQARHMNPV